MATTSVLRSKAHYELSKLVGVNVPFDGLMSVLAGEKIINIGRFDDNLMAAYNHDYKKNDSMKDFIERRFGQRAVELVQLLMA